MKVVQIPISMIVLNPEQPRKIFLEEELKELSDSILEYGILQPLIVTKGQNHTFSLVAGERRLRAAKMAGIDRVPAIVRALEIKEAAMISLVENVQRENLNFLEEAKAYKQLMNEYGLTQIELAKSMSKQQSTISNKMRLLSLPDDIQKMIIDHQLSERHARALLRLDDPLERKKIIDKVISNHLNVRQTEKLIEDFLDGKEKQTSKKGRENFIHYKIYTNTLKKAFNQVKGFEKNAKYMETDNGDFLEIKIIIPKENRCFT